MCDHTEYRIFVVKILGHLLVFIVTIDNNKHVWKLEY